MNTVLRRMAIMALPICITCCFSPRAFAQEYTVIGDRNGLEIRVPVKKDDTGNLNPGDSMSSCLKLVNTGSGTIAVYIRTNILSERQPFLGGRLAKAMNLVIRGDGRVIASDTFAQMAKRGNVFVGDFAPGEEEGICFLSDLPETAGNEYQGSSFKANWTFVTEGRNGSGPGDNGDDDPSASAEIGDKSAPQGVPGHEKGGGPPSEPKEEISTRVDIPKGGIPDGIPDMPKAGEDPPLPLYIVGAALVTAGVRWGQGKECEDKE